MLDDMLPELVAAERVIGSGAAETLQGILQRFAADLDRPQRLVLAGIAVLEKTRVGKQPRAVADALLPEAAGLAGEALSGALDVLANRFGALGWNPDLGRYELIADGVSRVQFEQWLRGKRRLIDADGLRQLFVRRGVVDCGLDAAQPSFAKEHDIRTPDWQFEPRPAHAGIVKNLIAKAADEWRAATLAEEAKGKLIYLYLHEDDDAAAVEAQVGSYLAGQVNRLGVRQAPIWVAVIEDREGRIGEHLARMEIIDGIAPDAERERFGRFLVDEQLRSLETLEQTVNNALRERRFQVAGFDEPPSDRLRQSAKRIFEQVYPEVLPFPFDGFTTRNGGGAKDAVLVAKALLGGQVTLPWIQLQQAKTEEPDRCSAHAVLAGAEPEQRRAPDAGAPPTQGPARAFRPRPIRPPDGCWRRNTRSTSGSKRSSRPFGERVCITRCASEQPPCIASSRCPKAESGQRR